MTPDILTYVMNASLGAAIAMLLVLALRKPIRSAFGARTAYAFWLVVPIAIIASLLPAEYITVSAENSLQTQAVPLQTLQVEKVVSGQVSVEATLDEDGVSGFSNVGTEIWVNILWVLGAVASFTAIVYRQKKYLTANNLNQLKSKIHIAENDAVGPAVIGILKPRIVVPSNFEQHYNKLERSLILAHENAHIRAGDLPVNTLAVFIRSLNWFNPIAYVAYGLFRVDQELACDERVMKTHSAHKKTYAATLLKSQLMAQPAPIGCAWLPEAVHPLKERVSRLKSEEVTMTRRIIGGIALAGALTVSGAGAWATLATNVVYLEPEASVEAQGGDQANVVNKAMSVQLVRFLLSGRMDEARELVKAGADVDYFRQGDGTPLVIAARRDSTEMVKFLIDAGADVNKPAPGDANPLIAAARRGNFDMVQLLVENGADVNGFVLGDETPLIGAATKNRLKIAKFLLQNGADATLEVETGNYGKNRDKYRSPMGQAVKHDHKKMQILLEKHIAAQTS